MDLSAVCHAESAADNGAHGCTQSHIRHTSHGAYVTYLGKNQTGGSVIHLIRIRNDRPALLATTPTAVPGSNGAHVMCDADEEVYVVAPAGKSVDGKEQALLEAYHVDRKTGAVTEYRLVVPFGHGSSFGYSSACIDPVEKTIYAVYSGGDAPGYFAWFSFDLRSRTWLSKAMVIDLKYRHCYSYCFTDGRGGSPIGQVSTGRGCKSLSVNVYASVAPRTGACHAPGGQNFGRPGAIDLRLDSSRDLPYPLWTFRRDCL